MRFTLYIAKRYLFSPSQRKAINIITWIASIGIVAGAMALFVVLSVFGGLKEFSLSFSNDFDPDLTALPSQGKSFTLTPTQADEISAIPGIIHYSKIVEERAIFRFNGKDQLAFIKGVNENYTEVTGILKSVQPGNWFAPETPEVVVGFGIAHKLSLGLFDASNIFEALVIKGGKGAINNPEQALNRTILIPVGVYYLNEDVNQKYVFCDVSIAQELLDLKSDQFTQLEFKIDPNTKIETINQAVAKIINIPLEFKTRAQLNASLYRMLNTENLVLYLLFTLVIVITLFTLIGALIMMILEKKYNLKTLLNIGAELKHLRQIFLIQGMMICVFGSVIGIFLGSILVLLQQKFEFFMITATMPYPVVFEFKNILLVIMTITTLGFIASWIASSRVNQKTLD